MVSKVYVSVLVALVFACVVGVQGDNAFGTNVAATLDPKTKALQVFVRGRGNALFHTTLEGTGVGWKSTKWHEHGGSAATSHPTATVNAHGMTVVYARGEGNKLHSIRQSKRMRNFESKWSPWSTVGPEKRMGSLAVAGTRKDGRIALLSLTPNHKVQIAVEKLPGLNIFSEWATVGNLPVHAKGLPQFVSPTKGPLHIYVVGDDYNIYFISANKDDDFSASGWKLFKGPKLDLPDDRKLKFAFGNVEQMVAASNSDGRQEVFAKTTSNKLVHKREELPSSGRWTKWMSFGRRRFPGTLTVHQDKGNSIIRIFGRGVDSQVWLKQQDRTLGWTSWLTIGGSVRFMPALVTDGDGATHVFGVGIDNVVTHKVLTYSGASQWRSLPGVLAI